MKSPPPTYSDEVVYDEVEEGNREKYLTNPSTTMTTMPNQYAYAKTPVTHSNSLGVPQRPQRVSQVHGDFSVSTSVLLMYSVGVYAGTTVRSIISCTFSIRR
jgi:hypothetical protein